MTIVLYMEKINNEKIYTGEFYKSHCNFKRVKVFCVLDLRLYRSNLTQVQKSKHFLSVERRRAESVES